MTYEPEQLAYLDELFGGRHWTQMTKGDLLAAVEDEQARAVAGMDQENARFQEEQRFSRAVMAAMRKRGATYGHEVYDDVARDLYGRHTALTRRVIARVEGLAREEEA